MFWKLSLLTSSSAAAIAVYNIVAGTESWGPSVFAAGLMCTVAAALLVGPYVLLGVLAFFVRSNRALSTTLFVFILLVSLFGTTFLSLEIQAYLNRSEEVAGGTDLGLLFVGVVQWISAILLSCIVVPVYFYLGSRNPKREFNQ